MAEDTKKNSKKSSEKTTTQKTEEAHKIAPAIPPGLVSIAISAEDLQIFANLMSICAKTFAELATQAAQENNESAFAELQARYRLSTLFADRLVEACKMPEPTSRDFH